MGAVVNNTRSEQDQLRTPTEAARDKRTVEGHSAASNKFMADLAKADEDEYGSFSLPEEMEREMAKVAEQAEMRSPETPRKASNTSYLATPGSKRKRDEDTLPTPVTGASKVAVTYNNAMNDDDVFATPSSKAKGGMWGGHDRFGFRSPSATPSHYQEPAEAAEDHGERSQQSYDIYDDVMNLLKDQHIDQETTSSLQELLNKHALKISGIAKGRDITRLALKAKDGKIAELQQKIAALEAEREMDKKIIRHFKSDMAHSIEKRRGRGRGRP
jgi:polyhydroxyalkanoate synthesis regulator phasin